MTERDLRAKLEERARQRRERRQRSGALITDAEKAARRAALRNVLTDAERLDPVQVAEAERLAELNAEPDDRPEAHTLEGDLQAVIDAENERIQDYNDASLAQDLDREAVELEYAEDDFEVDA